MEPTLRRPVRRIAPLAALLVASWVAVPAVRSPQLEMVWAVGLKYTDGLTRPWPIVVVGTTVIASVALLALAVRVVPVGTAYAVWTGIGTVGTVVLAAILFDEPLSPLRLTCIGLIAAGILGLKAVS